MIINKKLSRYIEKYIFPNYSKNDLGHNLDHINYVIDRCMKIVKKNKLDVNLDMIYTIAAYHDIGYYLDAKNHEKISAEMLYKDKKLKEFFNNDEIIVMKEAVYDHRASLSDKPRSIYGEIISSADRETRINVQLQRMYEYRLIHNPDKSLDWMIEDSRLYIINKFGREGYATKKVYFDDKDYNKFLGEISSIAENKEVFRKVYIESNNLDDK